MVPKTIAIDLDDTLNNLTETLNEDRFPYEAGYALPEATFRDYLARVRADGPEPGELLSTDYSFFRARIHLRCYGLARARPDGVDFMRWLKGRGWRIVICTHRDLRRAHDVTRQWLEGHGIPFDHLFMTRNKIVFCRAWGIGHLVDDEPANILHGAEHGIRVYYPIGDRHADLGAHSARGFARFEEVKTWIDR